MPNPAQPAFVALAFIWGAVWGSFLNVCIHRLPRGESLWRPGSRCPHCGTALKPWHNVPLVSFVVLRGRCAACRARIGWRYPVVEGLAGLLAAGLWGLHAAAAGGAGGFGAVTVAFLFQFAFAAALLAIVFIDAEHLLVPDVLTLPGVALGLLAALVAYPETGVPIRDALVGALAGGGLLLALLLGYARVTGRLGLGGGDVKLMAMVGAFLGWQALPFVWLASAVQGLLYAVLLLLLGRGDAHRAQLAALGAPPPAAGSAPPPPAAAAPVEARGRGSNWRDVPLPYGPFIALAALEWLFLGRPLRAWMELWLG